MLLADVKSVPGWNTAASIPPHTADTRAPETPVYFPIDGRCCQLEWRLVILLTRCCCCCSSFCEEPLRILVARSPLPPRRESGMVYSMRTCHCHSSRSVRAEGGEGRLHPCLPLQCGGCCCSEATPGRPLQSSSARFSTKNPRGPPRLWRWMVFLVHPWVRY